MEVSMSVSKINKKNFNHPLTDKWLPLINRFALRHNQPLLNLIQESYILEWRMQEDSKFKSERHMGIYFYRSLNSLLYRRVNNWGRYEPTPEKHKVSFGYSELSNIIDSIIKLRTFDEIYYDELVSHTVVVLAMKSRLAAQIFKDKMNMQIK